MQSTFKNLAPVAAGFGLKMLKKMGWEEGCPLGRSGRGIVEPIVVEVKMDRLGGLWCMLVTCVGGYDQIIGL